MRSLATYEEALDELYWEALFNAIFSPGTYK